MADSKNARIDKRLDARRRAERAPVRRDGEDLARRVESLVQASASPDAVAEGLGRMYLRGDVDRQDAWQVERMLGYARAGNSPAIAPRGDSRLSDDAGLPLDPRVRTHLEAIFDQDLGSIRVHAGPEATGIARGLGASAVANGPDVFLADPARAVDPALLAHEVVHVTSGSAAIHLHTEGEGVAAPQGLADDTRKRLLARTWEPADAVTSWAKEPESHPAGFLDPALDAALAYFGGVFGVQPSWEAVKPDPNWRDNATGTGPTRQFGADRGYGPTLARCSDGGNNDISFDQRKTPEVRPAWVDALKDRLRTAEQGGPEAQAAPDLKSGSLPKLAEDQDACQGLIDIFLGALIRNKAEADAARADAPATGGDAAQAALSPERSMIIANAMGEIGLVKADKAGGTDDKGNEFRVGYQRMLDYFDVAMDGKFNPEPVTYRKQNGKVNELTHQEVVVDALPPGVVGPPQSHVKQEGTLLHWCGIFAIWAVGKATGRRGLWKTGKVNLPTYALSPKKSAPVPVRPGDVGVLKGSEVHHCVIVRIVGDVAQTVEGNYPNEVAASQRPLSSFSYFYRTVEGG